MWFHIDPAGIPIYRQLVEQVRRSIAAGTLLPGDRLTPIREVASLLTVNPNTVARAYREMEQAGLIETITGKGSFIKVGSNSKAVRAVKQELWLEADRLIEKAFSLGLSWEEVQSYLAEAWQSFCAEED